MTDREQFMETQGKHFRQCAREARMALIIWLVALITIAGAIISMGYVPPESRPDIPPLIGGVPTWVFWGLFVPWLALIVVTWWFALMYMKDDEPLQDFPDSAES